MQVLIASLLLVCSIHAAKGSPGTCAECPSGWTYLYETGSCYKYYPVGKPSYWTAESTCAEVPLGMVFTPNSKSEYDAVISAMEVTAEVWIGLTDLVSEGTFAWDDGKPLDWTNWNTGEPNDGGGNEDCVYAKTSGLWNDNPCTQYKNILCEAPPKVCPSGWIYLCETDLCYKYYPEGKPDYNTAQTTCAEVDQGVPVTLKSMAEYDAIVEGLGVDTEFWIGLTDTAREGTFTWVDGGSLGWTNWNTGEPNDGGGNEDCVYVKIGGLWNDNPCTEHKTILCQAPRA